MAESCGGAVEEEAVGQITGLFRVSVGGTRDAPADVGPCRVNC